MALRGAHHILAIEDLGPPTLGLEQTRLDLVGTVKIDRLLWAVVVVGYGEDPDRAWSRDPSHLRQGFSRVERMVQGVMRLNDVERPVGEGQFVHVGLNDLGSAGIKIDADDLVSAEPHLAHREHLDAIAGADA